jgi:hypothetical protein
MATGIDARLFQQCLDVYEAMHTQSELQNVIDPVTGGITQQRLFIGHTTYLIERIGYTISNYTPIFRRLQTMGCIKQLQRGGRGFPSEWQLLKPPTERDFTRSGQRWIQDRHRLDDLEMRVQALEDMLLDEQAS